MKLRIAVDDKTYEVDVKVAEESARHPQTFVVAAPVAGTGTAFTVDAGDALKVNRVVVERA